MMKNIETIILDPVKYARSITIKKLVSLLQKLSDVYYTETNPLVDDDVYDALYDVLKEREPHNAYFFQTGVKKPSNKDVVLPYQMPSLNKIKPNEKTLERWFNTYTDTYIIMDKLDGISIQIHKNELGEIDMYTKKQTGMGTSKKHLLKYVVSDTILNKIPNNTSIRGELVISQKDFKKLNHNDEFKNPRSMMSGLVNVDKLDTRIANKAQFIAYSIIHPRYKIGKQLAILTKWGFNTVWYEKLDNADNDSDNINSIEAKLIKLLSERKAQSEFLIDGLVITDNSAIHEHSDTTPKYAIAFKMNMEENMKDAIVEEIEWSPTMYGYLQPVVRIKPIILDGNVTITYVSAHNARYVYDNNIGKGSIIKIIRSGDVIPYIVSIVKHNDTPDMPTIKYKWNETKIEIIVKNPTADILDKIQIKQNIHFFKTIKVKYLSDGIITKLHNAGYKTIIDILKASHTKDTELYDINGLGEKIILKIYEQIDKAFKKIKLAEFMAGSLQFGRGFGVRKLNAIIKKHPDILTIKQDIKQLILDIDGFSDTLADKFCANLDNFKKFMKSINKIYNIKNEQNEQNEQKQNNQLMINEIIVMTGKRNNTIIEFIENNGGKIGSSVSKNTTLVIHDGDINSSKMQKAKELNIKQMTTTEFIKQYKL